MLRLRKVAPFLVLAFAPWVMYQFFFYFARKPLNDALIEAVKANDLVEVKSLLERGADINCGDSTRFRSCTDANPPRTGHTPLLLATFALHRAPHAQRHTAKRVATKRDPTMLNLLLKSGANPNVGDYHNQRPLHFAASVGDTETAAALLAHGANVDVQEQNGDTPLIEASYRGHLAVVKLLLAHGANANAKGFLGFSALARATGYRDNLDIMKLLLAHGADANSRNKFGATPLHGATEYGRLEGMRLLLQGGADPNALDHNGFTPLMMVPRYGTKALDKWQHDSRAKIARRQAQMTAFLTN